MHNPPSYMISLAEAAARGSACHKSKRGAVLWYRHENGSLETLATDCNGPPLPMKCYNDTACRELCGQRCLHAESRALRSSLLMLARSHPDLPVESVHMLHVKIDPSTGKVVPGGKPGCWQCSREILDESLAGIWLYEATDASAKKGEWRFYNGIEFHYETLKNCDMLTPQERSILLSKD